MNQKALLGIMIAVLIPVIGYLAVKYASERAVVMPRKYYLDDIREDVVNGKRVSDTIWHQTANFKLTNQLGDTVELYDIKNKIIVADFFFAHCPTICPALTKNMQKLQASFATYKEGRLVVDSSIVHFLSFSVDPERDSAAALKNYADRFQANHDTWWFLTGEKKQIYDFALNELKLGLVDGEGVDTSYIHTQKYVLLDKNYIVRGYYDGLDTFSISKLARDIGLLLLEKDDKRPNNIFRTILDLSWLWLIVGVLIIIFMVYIIQRRKATETIAKR
jgi:protein SCO1/2